MSSPNASLKVDITEKRSRSLVPTSHDSVLAAAQRNRIISRFPCQSLFQQPASARRRLSSSGVQGGLPTTGLISSPSAQLYKPTSYRRGGVSYWLSVWTFDQLECGNVSVSQPRL